MVVGIIIVAIISWVVTTFGIQIFHSYERYAFIPQLIVLSILYGVSAKRFDLTSPSQGDPRTIAGNRLSFFSLSFSAAITYAGGAADFFVYYPPSTPRLPIFVLSTLGLVTSFTFALLVGIGLASAIPSTPSFSTAYDTGQGALLVAGFTSLDGFGKFCGVVIALGLVANIVPPTYVSGINFQILGRVPEKIPRFIWNSIGVIIYTVCALAGRDHLAAIFTNFLALMGYWLAIWIAITLEEHLIFRRVRGFDWTQWNQQSKLPLGVSALAAFLVGWAGAILCMAQAWYIGPIAKLVGENGADVCSISCSLFSPSQISRHQHSHITTALDSIFKPSPLLLEPVSITPYKSPPILNPTPLHHPRLSARLPRFQPIPTQSLKANDRTRWATTSASPGPPSSTRPSDTSSCGSSDDEGGTLSLRLAVICLCRVGCYIDVSFA